MNDIRLVHAMCQGDFMAGSRRYSIQAPRSRNDSIIQSAIEKLNQETKSELFSLHRCTVKPRGKVVGWERLGPTKRPSQFHEIDFRCNFERWTPGETLVLSPNIPVPAFEVLLQVRLGNGAAAIRLINQHADLGMLRCLRSMSGIPCFVLAHIQQVALCHSRQALGLLPLPTDLRLAMDAFLPIHRSIANVDWSTSIERCTRGNADDNPAQTGTPSRILMSAAQYVHPSSCSESNLPFQPLTLAIDSCL